MFIKRKNKMKVVEKIIKKNVSKVLKSVRTFPKIYCTLTIYLYLHLNKNGVSVCHFDIKINFRSF
jgi:hypothetical protein